MPVLMRRILPASLALVLLVAPAVRAQTCQGLPSFATAQVQVNGEASLTAESNAVGGGISGGLPAGPFGQVSLANRTHQDFGRSSLDVGAATGYEFALGQGSRVHLCPVLAGALQLGPNNAFNSDVHRLSQSARIGLSVGTELAPFGRWNVVPAFALSYAYQRDEAKDQAGAMLFRISDYYTLAQLGIGFVYKSTLSLRPYVDLPLWLDGGVPTVGVMVGYGLGRRSQ
jgi:hypothetical protein